MSPESFYYSRDLLRIPFTGQAASLLIDKARYRSVLPRKLLLKSSNRQKRVLLLKKVHTMPWDSNKGDFFTNTIESFPITDSKRAGWFPD